MIGEVDGDQYRGGVGFSRALDFFNITNELYYILSHFIKHYH